MSDGSLGDAGDELVSLVVGDGLGVIRMNRPPLNALNDEAQLGLVRAAEEAARRKEVRAVVVYGGPKAFAAGVDVKQMATMSYTDMVEHGPLLQGFTRSLAAIPKPTVAAITGYALGGGLEVALACDFRIAASDSVLGQPEILLGIIPGAGGTQRLARLIGPAKAKDLIFTGRMVKADEALRLGLIDEIVDVPASSDSEERVLAAAKAKMAGYAAGPAYALRAAKDAIDSGIEVDLQSGLDLERRLFASLFATKDREIGMQSFVEQGPGRAHFIGE